MKLKNFISRYLSRDRYFSNVDFSQYSLSVLEFRKIRASDRFEMQYEAWSRIYEYPLVIDKIKQFSNGTDISIHNSSWGFAGCHIVFKDALETQFRQVTNSDLLPSQVSNTVVWDITEEPPTDYIGKFDAVLNVSTVEEVDVDHLLIIKNLLDQIKPGGLLVMTFDLPGMQIMKLEKVLAAQLQEFDDNLNGENSKLQNSRYSNLNCGLLVLRKEEN
jgi:hypothetical protein